MTTPPRATRPLKLLSVEDFEHDALLLWRTLERGGFLVEARRVDSRETLLEALAEGGWDLVISDYQVPPLDGLEIVRVVHDVAPDLPVIIVSGTVGEDVAVATMRAGAQDFLVKGNLSRLVPAVERELRETHERIARRRADAALRASERRFRTLVAAIDGLVLMVDLDGTVSAVFGGWLTRSGFSEERFVGKTVAATLGGDVEAHAGALARARRGESGVLEWTTTEGADAPRQLEMTFSPKPDDGGSPAGMVSIVVDKTEQKQALARLIVADRMVSVGTLAGGVAHEINNPLAAVLANIDYVKTVLASGTIPPAMLEESRAALEEAQTSAGQVRQIVRDLKLFSGTGDEERRGLVDLNRVIDSSVRMAWNEIRHRAQLVKKYGDVPAVDANEARLGQMFLNLIVNAVQAIPEGHSAANEITLTTRVDDKGQVIAEVKDTGTGIPPEVSERLFRPFFTTKPVGTGTGLGLPICHRIVTSLGGTISIASVVGRGTTVTVTLPQAARQAAGRRPEALPTPLGGEKPRVLVIDDDAGVRASLRRTLAKDHVVVDVSTGALALARLEAGERFDVIICDLMMPEMTGMELHARLEAEHPDAARRVVFLTGGAFTQSARTFLESTTNVWFEKPYDGPALRKLIAERAGRG